MLSIHDNDLEDETIVVLRIVKDELCVRGGPENVEITKELLQSVQVVHSRYIILNCQN